MPTSVDVLVVGGGPSGSAAAHIAAAAGLSVLVVERGGIGRDKACGDMFMPSAVAALNRLGIDRTRLASLGGVPVEGIDILGERGRLWKVSYTHEPVWIVPRALIDQALRDLLPANAQVLYNASVESITPQRDNSLTVRVVLGTNESSEFRAQGVVLAGGAQDPLAARWGVSGARRLAPSISAYTPNPELELPAFDFRQSCRPGYRWAFPTGSGQANVGICSLAKRPGATIKTLGRELLEAYQLPEHARWRGGVGALWSGAGDRWHHPAGIVACGDAAGLVDPLNGEGLTAALTSGEAAGRAIAQFVSHPENPTQLLRYSRWVKSHFSMRYSPSPLRKAWRQLTGCSD